MAKARFKPEELLAQGRPTVATLPSSAPATPFLDPNVAQAEPQGSELYNLGTVQQAAASTRDADMFNPSYLQEPQNYPTGAEGGVPQPQGASPLLYPTAAETQPKLKVRLKPNEALALAEVNRPRRKSPDEVMDELAVGMFDPSKDPLPQDLWNQATQRRSKMIQEGRLPMEFGEIDSLADGLVWTKDAAYGVGSYILGTLGGAAASIATDPAGTARQSPATIGAAGQRLATELGLQTYQDIFNLTHEPKYRVKETGEFVAVNKTGLPLVMPPASGGNNVLSGDGIIDPRMPEQGIRSFAEQGKTLVPVTEQDLKDYRYGQYLDRMAMGAQSLEAQNFQVPSNLAQQVLATSAVTAPLAAFLAATDPGGTVGPNQPLTEVAVLAAQSAIPAGAASRSWGISRRVAGGLSKVAGAAEGAAGFFPDVETALRAKFVKAVTSGTNLEAGAQKTALQAAIDGGKTLGIASGAYAAATGLSAIDGVPGELKQAAWTAANLYSGYKGGMFVARQLRSASGFAKTVLKEVADPAQGLDIGARARVAANPDVPDFVRNVLRSPSTFRAMESTPARLAKNPELSPVSRAVFGKLSDYRFVQAARLAKDAAAGVPKGMVANAPFVAGAMASDDPERAGQMLAAGGAFGALGGVAGRFTEARTRSMERAESDIARMLVDIQAGNELGSGLGGDILRNRIRPGTQFQDGPGGFVLNPDREVSSFLTEVEMAGGDVSAFVRGKSFDELAQWAAYQGFFRDKVDLVPLNATDFKLNAEANGQNGAGAYFLQPSESRRARIFVNAESRRNGLAPHEYGHAVLRGGALSPDQIDAVHAEVNSRYAPDALRNMAGEYAATMLRAENAKQGIDIEPSPAAITAKINELSQGSMIKGSADGLDWLREEIFAEEFRNANIDLSRARRNIPLGANPVSFFENLLGAQSRALHMAGIDIDPQTGKPMGRDQIFKENRVAGGDPVVMKNYEEYVKQWKRWINDPTHEVDPGVPVSRTGDVRETADSPNVTWKDYGRGRMETEFAVKNPDGTVTPKDWKKDIKPTVRARQQAVREMSNRSKEVSAADDQTFGMRRRRDGRLETSGRRLPDSFFFIPQYKPFHDILRKINAADDIGETLQVRFFAKGKSKDVFKDGIKNTSAVNREALHGNFVAKKDGTLMWGYLDMTQFRNRAMKAIADKNPALAQYDWSLKAIMDDLPLHLTDQRRGKGGAFSVGPERANILNGLIGIGDGPLVGAFGKGTAYKTIHLDSIDAIVPTGKTGGEFDVYRANRNAMPDDPKPPVDMETDIDNNRMPQQIPREAQGMPDAGASGPREAVVTQDGFVQAPEDAPTFTLPRRAMAQFMPDGNIRLEDYADRPIVALPADRMGIGQMRVGPKGSEQILSVPGQGGAGFMEIYNGGGWAFTDTATADRFLGRLREVARPGDTSVIVGITALNEVNHLKNQTGQLAYVEALEAAIKNKSISKKQADAHIREIAKRIYTSEASPKALTKATRDKFKAMRSFDDFQKAVRAKSLNFADAAWLLEKMQQRTLPLPYKDAQAIGIAFDDVARQTADPRYAGVPFGTVVALLEVPINQAPSKNPFHYAYPAKVEGNRIGFLSKFENIDDLTSDPRIRNKQGRVTAQPLQTVLPVMDRIGQPARAQFMPDVAEVSTSTSVSALQKHPIFKAAKYDGSARAAYAIVESLVKPKAIQDVISKIDPNKPAYIIPVIAREGESANMLPLAMADKLSEATGIPIWNKLAKTSSQHNTGAKADARARTLHRWEGEPPPAGSQIVLVDDTYTTGQTLRSLAAVVGDPDAVATISVGRYTKQFTLQPDREQKLLAKAGLTKQQFTNLYGSEPKQILTGAQAQQYLLNGARGEQGLLARFPVERGGFSTQGIAGLTQLPEGVTTFSGGGLVEIGLRGIVRPTVAVEYSPAIAQAYRAAHGDHVKVQDIRTVSLEDHKGKFHYHASPVCKNSSLLKSAALGGGEKDLDLQSAQAVARHIDEIEPRVVTIENVPDYRTTQAADIIRKKLQDRGYMIDEAVYNAADYGAPTARRRYLLRAVKGGLLPEPVPQKGPGWYETVADMIEDLPDDDISRAQYIYRSMREQGVDPDNVSEPLLVSGTTLFKKVAFARPNDPAFTFKATPATVDRILLPGGRVKRVTARAKARMTGIPDSYPLPKDEKTALTIIGNGVPPALVRNVFGPVIEANK